MFFARLKAIAIVVVFVGGLVAFTVFLAIYAHNKQEGKPPAPTPQASSATGVQLPVAGDEYVAQEGDSCSGIAKDVYQRIGDEKDVREFSEHNSLSISQEARRRGVPYTDCPIRAGDTYRVPGPWVSEEGITQSEQGAQNDQTSQVDQKGSKGFSWFELMVGVAIGLVIGATAPPTPPFLRLFRRKKDPYQLSSNWEPPQEQ